MDGCGHETRKKVSERGSPVHPGAPKGGKAGEGYDDPAKGYNKQKEERYEDGR